MAVKMRLMRMGKKKSPTYRVVVVDGRAPRDGRYIEQIGRYDPRQDPSLIEIDNDRATDWLQKGAQPTDAVEKLLNISGAMNTIKVRTGQIHTVGSKPVAEPEPEPKTEPVEAVTDTVAETPVVEAGDEPMEEPTVEEASSDVSSEEE
jgi:small subunit ribosomal protein S16